MKLNPHPKPVRIRLSVDQQNGNGKIVYFGLDDLLKNFNFQSLIPHIVDKSLIHWLNQIRYDGIADSLMNILGIDKTEQNIEHDSKQDDKLERQRKIEQNKYAIITLLFDGKIADEMKSDRDFLSCLLKLSDDYKNSIKNLLESDAFSKYSEYEFLNLLLQGCDSVFKTIIEEKLTSLQKEEDWRKERERIKAEQEKSKQEPSKNTQSTSASNAKIVNIRYKQKWEDSVLSIDCRKGQYVQKGDTIINLRRSVIKTDQNGYVSEIKVIKGQSIKNGDVIATLSDITATSPMERKPDSLSDKKWYIAQCQKSYTLGNPFPSPSDKKEECIYSIFRCLYKNYDTIQYQSDLFGWHTMNFAMPDTISDLQLRDIFNGHYRILRFIMQTLQGSVDKSLINGSNGYACHYIYNTFTSLNGYFPSNHKFGVEKSHRVAYKQWFRSSLDFISENFENL